MSDAKVRSSFCEQKRSKKTLIRSDQDGFTAIGQKSKGFLLLFFKKEALAYFGENPARQMRACKPSLPSAICVTQSVAAAAETSLPENRIPNAF
jgi:hypothetical protein